MEDLAYLYPGSPPAEAARSLLAAGPVLVLVTDGPRPAKAFLRDGAALAVDVPGATVVDTIGAGDAFGGGFLAWWSENNLTRADLKQPASSAPPSRPPPPRPPRPAAEPGPTRQPWPTCRPGASGRPSAAGP